MNNIVNNEEYLRERTDETDFKKNEALMKDVIRFMDRRMTDDNLTHLSAPQIGYRHRIVGINMNGDKRFMINPIIYKAQGMKISFEKCVHFPNKKFMIARATDITMSYIDTEGETKTERFVGIAAILVQHAIDHIDGVMIDDIGLEVNDDFDNASDKEKGELIKAYIDYIAKKTEMAMKEVEKDAESKALNDSIEKERKKNGKSKNTDKKKGVHEHSDTATA